MFHLLVVTALLELTTPTLALDPSAAAEPETKNSNIAYRTVKLDGIEIFNREAGPKDGPTILLLHGFPSSSHMFRNLIP